MSREFTKVGVIGLGTMGVGIVEVFARNGIDVVAMGGRRCGRAWQGRARQVHRPRARPRQDHPRGPRRPPRTGHLHHGHGDFADCQLVVEAVPEHLHLKKELFGRLDTIVAPMPSWRPTPPSLPVTGSPSRPATPSASSACTSSTRHPSCSSSVIRTVITADDVFGTDVKALAERLGKKPVIVGDKAGFIANALLFGYLNHAVAMYESKYATREDIDASMRFGCGYPMGPLALLDLIGLDTAYEILDTMYKQGRDRLHAPARSSSRWSAPVSRAQNGRGFYTYAAAGSPEVVADGRPRRGTRAGVEVRTIESVGVIGSGTMATGIVEVFARPGMP